MDNLIFIIYHGRMIRRMQSSIAGSGVNRRAISLVKDFAVQNRLKGFIFTKSDGSLNITAEGEENDLARFATVLEKTDFFSRTENFYINWGDSQEIGSFYFIN